MPERERRAEELATSFEKATGLKANVAFAQTDGRTILTLDTGGNKSLSTKIIDNVLVDFRKKADLNSDQLGFADGDGKSIHTLIENPKSKEGQIVLFVTDNEFTQGRMIKALNNSGHSLQDAIEKEVKGANLHSEIEGSAKIAVNSMDLKSLAGMMNKENPTHVSPPSSISTTGMDAGSPQRM